MSLLARHQGVRDHRDSPSPPIPPPGCPGRRTPPTAQPGPDTARAVVVRVVGTPHLGPPRRPGRPGPIVTGGARLRPERRHPGGRRRVRRAGLHRYRRHPGPDRLRLAVPGSGRGPGLRLAWLFSPSKGRRTSILSRAVADRRGIRLVVAIVPAYRGAGRGRRPPPRIRRLVQLAVVPGRGAAILIRRNASQDERVWINDDVLPMLRAGGGRHPGSLSSVSRRHLTRVWPACWRPRWATHRGSVAADRGALLVLAADRGRVRAVVVCAWSAT